MVQLTVKIVENSLRKTKSETPYYQITNQLNVITVGLHIMYPSYLEECMPYQ
ncbi:hypothetical protein Nther_2089 [Natranaerobius thermophilus JW/NM-WN-LF]|uniref:Uncharacterized protein n=1 Tax=Natranaerobius thermophilus (strain ATCC BAA-1301 / DSM 18059 / JW/NM-WN-LF) TaxID=457570 RepID=B2A7E7_NATTJ|nr:hypothetical protein Nther_2089 [Natranaerobius thermophilus JW/NM-WN-LF]